MTVRDGPKKPKIRFGLFNNEEDDTEDIFNFTRPKLELSRITKKTVSTIEDGSFEELK